MPILTLAATPSGFSGYDYKNYIWGLVVFAALILLFVIATNWMSRRVMGNARNLRVIERLTVSREASILLVEIGESVLAVSATKEGLRLLREFSAREAAALRGDKQRESDSTDHNSTFWKRFSHNMRIQMRLLPKNTPIARPETTVDAAPPAPSPFAMALLRAQADDNKDALKELLVKQEPISEPVREPRNEFVQEPRNEYIREPRNDFIQEPEYIEEPRTKPDPVFRPDSTGERSGNGSARDYNAAIESLKQMGKIETPIVAVAPTMAAAAYKTSNVPKQEQSFVPEQKPEIPRVSNEISTAPREAAPSRDDKVDELFDRISKRNSRYTKKE